MIATLATTDGPKLVDTRGNDSDLDFNSSETQGSVIQSRAVLQRSVKHRRELAFAALPTLFAIHQFIEGFVWLGLDGILSPAVAHNMGAAFMLYAQGLLPFLLPLSVLVIVHRSK